MADRKITILIGIPGSGKTTWAKRYLENNLRAVHVSRDDIRMMYQYQNLLPDALEVAVSKVVKESILAAFEAGFEVVYDACNVESAYIREIEEYADSAYIDYFLMSTPLEVCLERNVERDDNIRVPDDVMTKMYNSYINLLSFYDFTPKSPKSRKTIHQLAGSYLLPQCYIFDIDGTVAHMNGQRSPYDWRKVGSDIPDPAVKLIYKAIIKSGAVVFFVSGRDEVCRPETEAWLEEHGFNKKRFLRKGYIDLFMRPKDNGEKDSLIKKNIYETHFKDKWQVVCVFDDRDQVVNMWRKLGIKVAQMEYGRF